MYDLSLSFAAIFSSGIQPFAEDAPQIPNGPGGPHHKGQEESEECDH